MPNWAEHTNRPTSFTSYIKQNLSIDAHTLILTDIGLQIQQAIEQLKVFAMQDNYQYWILVFMEVDPLLKPLKSHPEFEAVNKKIKDRFWENQTKLKKSLEEQGLI